MFPLIQDSARRLENSRTVYDSNIPLEHAWRLFIDLDCQSHPLQSQVFEIDVYVGSVFHSGEPGYFQAMNHVFQKEIRDGLGVPLVVDSYRDLHDHCIAKVRRSVGALDGEGYFKEGFAGALCSGYTMELDLFTSEGKKELQEKGLIGNNESDPLFLRFYFEQVFDVTTTAILPTVQYRNEAAVRHKIEQLIQIYYSDLSQATDFDQKLATIVDFCRSLEILHAFADGNQRTIAFALLTKLLLENGFKPAILNNPAMFDGYYSTKQMIDLVKQGQINYEKVIGNYDILPFFPPELEGVVLDPSSSGILQANDPIILECPQRPESPDILSYLPSPGLPQANDSIIPECPQRPEGPDILSYPPSLGLSQVDVVIILECPQRP